MVKIVAVFNVLPGKKDDFLKLAKDLVDQTRAEEGCISYGVHQNAGDENNLLFMEEWKDQAAIDFHNSSDHFTTIVPQLVEMSAPDVTITVCKELI